MKNRKRTRLKDYDYSKAGCYFITICTKDRINYFGKIKNEKMILNDCGKVAFKNWENISVHFNNAILDEFIVMPNHIHGIIGLIDASVGDAYMRPLPKRSKMLLSKIIQQYKASVSRDVNKSWKNFSWQKSFYDRIVRNEKEFENIQAYIRYNPDKWEWDIENKINLNSDKKYYENYLRNPLRFWMRLIVFLCRAFQPGCNHYN